MATNFKLKRSSVQNKRPSLSNVESGELALNTFDGSLFTQRDGIGLSTVTNLTPWFENYGGASIYYSNSVGIGTTNPLLNLDVRGSIGGFNDLRAPHSDDVVTYTITVASKDTTHRYQGQGSGNGYKVNGEFSPFITLTPGRTYKFNQADATNSGHPIVFYLKADKTTEYTTGVTYYADGVKSTSSAYNTSFNGATDRYTQIVVGDETPVVLHYQCYNHGYMGHAVQVNSNVVNTNYDAILRGGLNVSGRIVGAATSNTIPFLYNAFSDLPSASTYHGAFAHVHTRGKGYFAHAANWYELVNKELDGTIGVGTEQVRVGVTTVTDFNATGNVTLGDADTDNVVFNAEVNSHIIPNTNLTYDLGSTTKKWRTIYAGIHTGGGSIIGDDIITRNLLVNGITTATGNVDFNGDLDVDGTTNLDDINVSAGATFGGIIDAPANTHKIAALYNNFSDLPNAGTYHGMFAHVHARGKGYFAHGGAWYELVNKELDGTIGVGTEQYNIGIITATSATFSGNVSIAGTLTYQDVTNVDSVGIATARIGLDVLSGGINAVGIVTADGLDAIGIQSGGVNITTGVITAINFTGTGNTVTYDSSTKVVSVSVGGAGGGSGTGGKFVENNTGIHTLSNVGIGTTNASDKLKVLGDVAFTGALKVSPLGLSGSNGNYLKSVGTGVTWAAFPTSRTVGLQTATANQTSFPFTYNVGFLDVYINGVKLTTNEFTATNGTSVVLTEGAFVGDQVQLISFNTVTSGGGGGGSGITDVVQDATPQLGGNLDLNSKNITGSGNLDYTGNLKISGVATATTFVGNLTGNASGSSGSCTGNSATATEATNVTVTANNSTNETVYPLFVDGATGTQGAETDTGLNYNPSTGRLTAVSYAGDGSALTGISGSQNLFQTIAVSGQSNVVADSTTDTLTLVAGSNMTITTNAGSDTITFASSGGGGGGGNAGFSTAGGNFTVNAGVTTVIDTFNINTNTKLSEYTIHLENVNGNIQSQKVLVMNYGAGIGLTAYSSEYGIMFHPNQIADIGVVVTAGICSLTATTKSGITGITTFSLTRQDQS
tara:strand:- start:491 stop:3664 length:3174 start_codon:yes stop_codon:yes gene_type:complete